MGSSPTSGSQDASSLGPSSRPLSLFSPSRSRPTSEQRRIFEKFYRLDPDMNRGIGGTGLGLYICRELVRRVNGRIWVESESGKGSTFFVEVPQEQAAVTGGIGLRRAPAETV